LEATFDFSYTFLNFPLISPARWLESVNTTMAEKRKKKMEVQLFEDSEQDKIALYDELIPNLTNLPSIS